MAEVKHTPGPWGVEDPMDHCLTIVANPSAAVCDWIWVATCDWPNEDDHDLTSSEVKANARLIAAAPDLFEAGTELQAARKAQKLAPSAENLSRVRAASDAFDAALSKATTQQEGR